MCCFLTPSDPGPGCSGWASGDCSSQSSRTPARNPKRKGALSHSGRRVAAAAAAIRIGGPHDTRRALTRDFLSFSLGVCSFLIYTRRGGTEVSGSYFRECFIRATSLGRMAAKSRAQRPSHLARVVIDANHQRVAVGPASGPLVEVLHDDSLAPRVATVKDDHHLVGLHSAARGVSAVRGRVRALSPAPP